MSTILCHLINFYNLVLGFLFNCQLYFLQKSARSCIFKHSLYSNELISYIVLVKKSPFEILFAPEGRIYGKAHFLKTFSYWEDIYETGGIVWNYLLPSWQQTVQSMLLKQFSMQVDGRAILQPKQLCLHFQIAGNNRYFYKLVLTLSYTDTTKLLLPQGECLVLVIMNMQFQSPS